MSHDTKARDSLSLIEYSSKGIIWIQEVKYLKEKPEFLAGLVFSKAVNIFFSFFLSGTLVGWDPCSL